VHRGDTAGDRPVVLVLCTGNAARSVMGGVMLESEGAPVRVVTAGTHVVEHQPMSRRTRDALAAIGLDASSHRSRQLTDADLDAADLVIAMAAEHVRYVRRRHPQASDRTATLRWLVGHLPGGPTPLSTRVAGLALADVDPADQGDVDDPAGGDEEAYAACAVDLSGLVGELAGRLG
jgi:protein-tyrosine-phosphatase